jgi:hypothetical protein
MVLLMTDGEEPGMLGSRAAVDAGILRRLERFTSAEVRTWWINGQCALILRPQSPLSRELT